MFVQVYLVGKILGGTRHGKRSEGLREIKKMSRIVLMQSAFQTLLRSSSKLETSEIGKTGTYYVNRWYRGDSGDMTHRNEISKDDISKREEELLAIAKPKSEKIEKRHFRMPVLEDIPPSSLGMTVSTNLSIEEKGDIELQVRKKRLIYRAKQRGWSEVDLLLGTWAFENVPNLNPSDLDEFENFVNLETIDIYNIVTLRIDVPEELKRGDGDGVVERIQKWARSSPLGKGDPATYAKVKAENNLI